MKAFVAALLGTVALMLQLPTSGAQSSLTLTSSVPFDPPPSLCPGSTVQFNCVAVVFLFGIDWERNENQFQQYTATSDVNVPENPISGLSVVLNSLTVIGNPVTNVTFDSTVTAVVNEGISSGDIITCGSALVETTNLTANYIAIPPPPQPPNTLRIDSSSSYSNNSVRLTVNFDPSFSEENRVEKYCIRSQNGVCPNDSCVTVPGGNYMCDGLETGVEYNFTVRAVNCRDQESDETEVITVTPQIPLRPSSCQAFAVYNQSRNSGALSGITILWSRVEDPSNITNLIPQNVLFYNLSFVSTGNTDTVMLPLSSYDELCAADDSCNFTISDERLTGSGTDYRVQVVAGNIVGTGEPLNCDGQINRRNSVFDVSTAAPSSTDSATTIKCRFSSPLTPSSNTTRECELCYSDLVNSQTPSRCMTQGTTDGDDSLVTFMIQLPSGGPYGPFFYQLTAIEDNVTLAVVQGQQYTGCDPLLLGSVIISSSDVNSRCSSLISSSGGGTGSQSQVEGDNGIIFCYSSPGGGSGALQGTVATAFCDDGYEREGAETVTCGPNGSWGDLPRCSRSSQMAIEALLGWQVALIVIGVLLWFLAVGLDIVGVVLLILLAREKFNASFRFWHGLFIFLLILTTLLLVVCVALWIALGVIVSNGREVGDDAFINARAGLCIAAFILSLLAVLSAIVALLLTRLMPKVLSSKGSVEITHTEEIAKEIPPENNDKRYDTLPASPQEEILLETSSERKDDLASNQAMVPVEISIVNNGEVTSDPSTQEEQHSITEHDGGDKMNGSREALLSEEEKQPKPIEDEAIRNLLHELQIEPLTVDTQAAIVSEPGNRENTRGDEVTEAGQSY